MSITRRQFMAASAASLASAGAVGAGVPATTGQLVHTVYFWLKNPDSVADRDALIAGLKTLKQVSAVKSLHVGVPANTEKRDVVDNSFSVFELMFFDDLAGQAAYQQDPIHLAFVETCSHLWEKVVVHDSFTV